MRWALERSRIRVYETRYWEDCVQELDRSPSSIVGLELDNRNLEEIIAHLLHLPKTHPESRVMVLASREFEDAFNLVYEAGAVHVVASTRNLDSTARLVERHLESVRKVEREYRQVVRERLPW